MIFMRTSLPRRSITSQCLGHPWGHTPLGTNNRGRHQSENEVGQIQKNTSQTPAGCIFGATLEDHEFGAPSPYSGSPGKGMQCLG